MDRITRYARPHCYDASRGPLSFLDNGQRSRSSPRINVDSITRRACPERQPSDSNGSGFASSRLRAQSTDSLTWRRAVAMKTRQQGLAPRQHQSHAELRSDPNDCLLGTIVVDFSDTQIGEPVVFENAKPLECSTPKEALTNGNSSGEQRKQRHIVNKQSNSLKKDREHSEDTSIEKPPTGSKEDLNESKVRPVVETVAVLGRRLSYSKAAGADRLDPSDLDDIARQIGLIKDTHTSRKDIRTIPRSQTVSEQPSDFGRMESAEQGVTSTSSLTNVEAATEASVPGKSGHETRSRKSRMGWLGGLFRRLRHWPDSSSGDESKKHRRRAASLPPAKSRGSSRSQASDRQSSNSPSTAGGSPSRKKSAGKETSSAKSSFKKRDMCEKPVTGVSRSRTVDDMERARAYGIEEPELVLPKFEVSHIVDSNSVNTPERNDSHIAKNGHVDTSTNSITDTVEHPDLSKKSKSSSQPPSYCNLAILAYGYSAAYGGGGGGGDSGANVNQAESEQDISSVDNSAIPTTTEPIKNDLSEEKQSEILHLVDRPVVGDESTDTDTVIEKSHDALNDGIDKNCVINQDDLSNDTSTSVLNSNHRTPSHSVNQSTNGHTAFISENTHRSPEIDITNTSSTAHSSCNDTVEIESQKHSSRVKISIPEVDVKLVNDVEEKKEDEETASPRMKEPIKKDSLDTPDVVVRRKKVRTVSCSEAPDRLDTVPRSSLIMLAVSQGSPRPKTELVDTSFPSSSKFCPMSMSQHEDIVPSGSDEKDGFYYLHQATQVEAKFREKMRIIEEDLSNDSHNLSDEVSGILRSIVGKTNLLLTDKFAQLRGLCQQNISEQVDPVKQRSVELEGFPTRNSDLDGYWALVQLQIDDVEAQFVRVEKLRKDNWQIPADTVDQTKKPAGRRPVALKKKKKPPSASAVSDKTKSAQAQSRLEARKRLEMAKREAASKMKSAQNHNDGDVIIFV